MKKFGSVQLLAIVMMALLLPLIAHSKMVLKVQSSYNRTLPILGTGGLWWSNKLESASGGEIKVKLYDSGKLVKAFEILDAVSAGQIDAGIAGASFWAGKIPAATIFSSLPFGPEADAFLAWMYKGNGLKLHQELYDKHGYNVKVLPLIVMSPETAGWFKKPINSVEDLKGLKMRFSGYGGKVMQKLGVNVSMMAPSELFPALEKGVLDATEFSMPSIDKNMGFYKVAKYNYFPGWHQQATLADIYINKSTWEKMSDSQRALIEMSCKASVMNTLAEGEASQGYVLKENAEKHGVINKYWSKEMLEIFRSTWNEVASEMSASDADFKRIYEDLNAFRAEYEKWSKLGFLPRD